MVSPGTLGRIPIGRFAVGSVERGLLGGAVLGSLAHGCELPQSRLLVNRSSLGTELRNPSLKAKPEKCTPTALEREDPPRPWQVPCPCMEDPTSNHPPLSPLCSGTGGQRGSLLE